MNAYVLKRGTFKLSFCFGLWSLLILLSHPSIVVARCDIELNCPCITIWGSGNDIYLVRATVSSTADDEILLTALEIFKSTPEAFVDLSPGETFGGLLDDTIPCGGEKPNLSSGDEVLAVFTRGSQDAYPDCTEYKTCTREKCGSHSTAADPGEWDRCDGQCVSDTVEACAVHREEALTKGTVSVVPWEENLALRYEETNVVTIPASQITDLLSIDDCTTHFPNPETEPCDDTVEISSLDCAFTAGGNQPRFHIYTLLSLLF